MMGSFTCAAYAKSTPISSSHLTLYKGQSKKLSVKTKKKIRWTSSRKKVASVSKKGKVYARKKGKATVKAKIGKKTYRCVITVKNPSIGAKKRTVSLGTAVQFKAYGLKKVKWSTSNKNKAAISQSGQLITHEAGKVVVKAKAGKKTYQSQVTVKTGVNGKARVGTVALLSRYDINVPQLKNAVYASSQEGVAVTTKGGMVKPISKGKTDITVTGIYNKRRYRNIIHLNVSKADVLTGIDLSSHNGDVNFKTLRSHHISFAIVRAGAGNINDTKFVSNVKKAHDAGMKVGVYWYLRSNDSRSLMTAKEAHAQASMLVKALRNNKIKLDLPIYLDLESSTLYNTHTNAAYIESLVSAFRDELGVYGYDDVGIYSGFNYFRTHLNSSYFTYFSHLWLARYGYPGTQPSITIAGQKLQPEIWQSNSTYNVAGTNGSVDLNYFY